MKTRTFRRNRTLAALVLAAAAGATALAPVTADARGGRHGPGPGGGMFGPVFYQAHLSQTLELDDAQRARLREVIAAAQRDAEPFAERMVALHGSMHDLRDGPFDEQRYREVRGARSELMTELGVIRARARAEIEAMLTDEQRERFRDRGHDGHRGSMH